MKTAEEKANEYLCKSIGVSLGSPLNAAYNGYIAGYAEAMRWRDPKQELPNEGEEVQLKIFDTYHNKQEYTHDVYLGGRWRFYESKYIEVLGWRPVR